MIGFLIAILSGACMSVQGVFNTQVTKDAGVWVTNIFVQLTALLVCIAGWYFADKRSFAALSLVEPKYMLLGGAIGAVITFTVIKSMASLGPTQAVLVIVISQILVAYLIELFGLFGVEKQPFQWNKVWGMVLAVAGIFLFKFK